MTIHPHVQKLLGICALAATLAGCSNAESHTHAAASNRAETTSDAAPAASVEDPETTGDTLFGVPVADLPFGPGPFDPSDPDFDQFNPCTEIPEEAINSLGFSIVRMDIGDSITAGTAACPLSPTEETNTADVIHNSSIILVSTDSQLGQESDLDFEFFEQPNGTPFSEYTLKNPGGILGCASGIITDRGRWELEYVNRAEDTPASENCKRATDIHKLIIKSFN